jgi:hypothetical protein
MARFYRSEIMAIGDVGPTEPYCDEIYAAFLEIETPYCRPGKPKIYVRTIEVYAHQSEGSKDLGRAEQARDRKMAEAIGAFVREHHHEWEA